MFTTSIGFSQIPSNYYDSANGLSGYALKTELKTIITNGHIDQGNAMIFTGFIATHSDNVAISGYENDNSILLYYTENPSGADPYNFTHGTNQCGSITAEGSCYNAERIVPQSAFGAGVPMKNDIHHVIPSDGFMNNQRGNLPFGSVGTPDWTSLNGSKRGVSSVSGYSGNLFEPIDEFKGDIARALLYFVTRYEDTVDSYTSFDMFNGTENQALTPWAIAVLLDWHNNVDPVDQREIDRNNAAYNYQGNANPYVDHPEYVDLIWLDTQAPTVPTNVVASNPSNTSLDLSWSASTDNISVTAYDIYINSNFSFSTNANNTNILVDGLDPNTNYCFTIKARDTTGNESGFSNQDCETTTNNIICLTETFENIGPASSSYTNVSWIGDDGGTWNATDARTDQTINSKAITVRNGDITLPITNDGIGTLTVTTQRQFSGSSGTFNVSVNGTSVGTINYDETAKTITVANINIENNVSVVIDGNSDGSNRVKFDDVSYTCYSSLSVDEFSLSNLKLHPNPFKNNLTIDLKSSIDTDIEIYDILGKRVLKSTISETSTLNLQALKTGIFIVKITQNNSTITKKLIKQ
jgi:endonuclease I/chitodextrinase